MRFDGRTEDGRFLLVKILILGMGGALLLRLYILQIANGEYYRDQAEKQHGVAFFSFPTRGTIYFEDKQGELSPAAVTQRVWRLAGNPSLIKDSDAAWRMVSPILGEDARAQFIGAFADTEKTYAVDSSLLSEDQATRIQELGLSGFWIAEEETRSYPFGMLASHILGFAGFDEENRERKGMYGLERSYEEVLGGAAGSMVGERTADGKLFSFTDRMYGERKDGNHIVLTIDPVVQSFTQRLIARVQEQWHARSAGAIVLEPTTGKIRAMEHAPAFDPNAYSLEDDYDVFLNPLVQNVFEMGSIMKPLTMAAGIDAQAITEQTTYYDAGSVQIADAVIRNYDGKGRGRQSMFDILNQSLNTGSVFIMQQLGARAFRDYMERFGFGERTGIDLPYEVEGNITNLEKGGSVEYATASFGQGIAVTPLAFASAVSALANGGNLMRPYMVDRIIEHDASGEEKTEPRVRRRVLGSHASETVSRMLVTVVDKTLAGGIVHMPEYSIAAKTGTAQISKKESSGYSDEYLHTFFGYAPAFDPRFLILLYLEQPRGVTYSSQTLAEPFRELVEFMIRYYEIPPDRAGT